ncbi:MAG: periplasmic heavy metal sensor [Pseudomonadota bacterium]
MTRGRILRIAFVVIACLSLLANAVVLGVGKRLADRGLLASGVGQMVREMPPEARRAYLDGLRAERPALRELAADLRRTRREMIALASADEVDTAALEAAMAEVRRATARLQEAAHGALLETARTRSE